MTDRDDIIRMAREAGFCDASQLELNVEWTCVRSELEAFAALIAAAELRRLHEEIQQWQEKCNTYMELHDAVVKDSDRLYALNAELVEALEMLFTCYKDPKGISYKQQEKEIHATVRAALRKAQGDNNAAD